MKAAVAYEAPHRGRRYLPKDGVKPLKWHNHKSGYIFAQGQKGVYSIHAQKPNRRRDIFKWALMVNHFLPGSTRVGDRESAMLNGQPMSCDDREKLKAEAAIYDAMPQGIPVAIVATEHKAGEACTACGRAAESPTREEWEVIVSSPPAAHRGAILAMGLGETQEVGNKIILRGFHDDEQAARTAGAIARTYKVGVTFGPRNALYEAAETSARRPEVHNFDEHAATELELYADNTAELYNQKVAILENLKKRLAKGTYDKEKAIKLWMYWVDAAAKRYAKEFGGTWSTLFSPTTRLEVARREEERERAEMQLHRAGEANPLA